MSDRKLAEGETKGPFWGAATTYITGQDQLGMQLASISTYSALLPGLTNLTQRLRYYGFYAWLLQLYRKRNGRDSVDTFRRFMRRGELLLAFIMVNKNGEDKGVVGSRFARKDLGSGNPEIDLALGADRLGHEGGYWNFRSGAFGQYYQGPLQDIGLIKPSDIRPEIFVCTKVGCRLAECFEAAIPEEVKEDFHDAIEKGKVPVEALDYFFPHFNLSGIEIGSGEWSVYIEVLFGPDSSLAAPENASWMRKQSLLLFLRYRARGTDSSVTGFARSFYAGGWPEELEAKNAAAEGWYFFGLNELGHFAMETLLWAFLAMLDENGPGPFTMIVDRWVEGVPLSHPTFLSLQKAEAETATNPFDLADAIAAAKDNAYFECAVQAIRILAILVAQDPDLDKPWVRYSRPGDTCELLLWLQGRQELPFPEFLFRLLTSKVLGVHLEVAMRKMGSRNENTLKFHDEDGILRHIETVPPIWTGPRLYSLYNFMVDLKLTMPGGGLTDVGKEILRSHSQ